MIEIPIVSSEVRSDLAGPLAPPFQVMVDRPDLKTPQLPPFSLDALVCSLPFLPMQTAVLGKCLDGHPILFDLKDPRPGPILVVGDHSSGKTSLLKTIAHSLILNNRSYEVDFNVITSQPHEWNVESSRYAAYFPTISSNYERSAGDMILSVCDLVESRQHGKRKGACRLLIIDGFETIPHMDFDVRLNFEWLLQEGPAYQVWPVVAVTTESAQKNQHWMNFFRTRVAGFISNQKTGRDLSLLREVDLSTMEAGRQFAVRVGRAAYQFWLPDSKY